MMITIRRGPGTERSSKPGHAIMDSHTDLTSDAPMRVLAGEIIVYRLFDIAYAIDLGRAETLWRARAGATSARQRLRVTPPKAVAYDVPPLLLTLAPERLALPNAGITANVIGRLYDFGVLALSVCVPARELDWDGFIDLSEAVNALLGPGSETLLWSRLADSIRTELAPALTRPAASLIEEDYLVAMVTEFDRPMTSVTLWNRLDLVPLLSGERRTLSEAARQDLLRKRFSYYADDLAVLTWDRAFVYEPRGETDVLDILEVTNAQLLEMRFYDELLDDELPRMYDLVESTRRGSTLFGSRRFSRLARRFYTLVAEVTELTERVDNALQVTEDVYLARIYTAALELFRVPIVGAAVDRKLSIIRDTYLALYNEASGGRAAAMELAIVLLIVVEIVLALLHR